MGLAILVASKSPLSVLRACDKFGLETRLDSQTLMRPGGLPNVFKNAES